MLPFERETREVAHEMRYRLLDGRSIDLSALPGEDLAFLLALQRRATDEEDFFDLERSVCGPGAYPLKGSERVTREVHATPLFLVAEDIAFRAAIRQGFMAPRDGGELAQTQGISSVSEAAQELGITRSAVIKAAQAGRLKGRKIGKTWVLLAQSVQDYEVAQHRVAAGKAARRRK